MSKLHLNPTLAIFEEVNKLVQDKKSSSLPVSYKNSKSNFAEGESKRGSPESNLYKEKFFLQSVYEHHDIISTYLRKSCWKIPLKEARIQCYLEKSNSKVNPIWTLYWEFGLFKKYRKFLLGAQKCKSGKENTFVLSQDFEGGSDQLDGDLYVGTLERSSNSSSSNGIFRLYDNGSRDEHIIEMLRDEMNDMHAEGTISGQSSPGTIIVKRRNMASIYILKQEKHKGTSTPIWRRVTRTRPATSPRMFCACLTPKLTNDDLRSNDPDDENVLERSLFSKYNWQVLQEQSRISENVVGELKKICYQGIEDVSQLVLKRRQAPIQEPEPFSLTKLQREGPNGRKSYQLKFAAPFSISHAFATAISVVECGFD